MRGAAAMSCECTHEKKKERKTYIQSILKTKKQKNKVACNADSGLLLALRLPRSAFLADFQPAGASDSPPGLKEQKDQHKTSTKKPICVYRGMGRYNTNTYAT
jgi:hypothetical protein